MMNTGLTKGDTHMISGGGKDNARNIFVTVIQILAITVSKSWYAAKTAFWNDVNHSNSHMRHM